MSVIRPDFLKVLPSDVGRVGVDGACVLALVRYATAIGDDRNGRLLLDGAVWWQASQSEIGASLGGVDRYGVMRTVSKLESAGELVICFPTASSDRTKAYRVLDQPLCENALPVTSQCADPHDQCADSHTQCADSHDPMCRSAHPTTSFKELKEEEKKGEKGVRADWLDDEPRCEEHSNTPHPPACHRCKRVREQTETARPRPSTTDALVAQTQALKAKFATPPEVLP